MSGAVSMAAGEIDGGGTKFGSSSIEMPRRASAWSDDWVKTWRQVGDDIADHSDGRFYKLAMGQLRVRKRPRGKEVRLFRLRELEDLISIRHGSVVPETDDADLYILVAAYAINALCISRGEPDKFSERLRGWCHRFVPWALARAGEVIGPILRKLEGRKYDLSADEAARLLNIRLIDKWKYGFKTIGGCDVTTSMRKKISADRKRKMEKARQAENRLRQGRRPHCQSLSQTRPWEAEGISRRTWERRRKADAEMLPVGFTQPVSNTFASSATAPVQAQASKGSSLLISGTGSDCAAGPAGRAYLERNSKSWDWRPTPVIAKETAA